jgi:16S rRNA (cytosine967-C5)-methyltransferase
MRMSDARRLAFEVLADVNDRGAFADAALGRALARAPLPNDDRRLATQLVYGVLARQAPLDHTIDAYAKRSRVDDRVRIALRLGLFQIAFLDRVPHYAAVDTAVALVRENAPYAAGFVNAVLRRATRDGLAAPPAKEPQRSAVLLSHPAWLVETWRRELGADEADALMDANNRPMPTVLRALIERGEAMAALRARGIEASAARYAPDAIACSWAAPVPGIAIAQGEASQLVALLPGVRAGDRVLDACAAPGGKTAYLAAQVGPTGRITAVDRAPSARRRIEATCRTAGVANVEIVEGTIENLGALGEFDAVLADAPCSGLGTLREHPEIRWRRSPGDVADLAARQRSILRAAAQHVRRGGVLVYATCTLTRAENDAVVDDFLAEHSTFAEDADGAAGAVAPFLDARARLRTFPHRDDMGGFFAARMRRSR